MLRPALAFAKSSFMRRHLNSNKEEKNESQAGRFSLFN